MKKVLISIVVAAALLGGCETNPVTGRKQLMILPEETAIESSAKAYTEMLTPFQQAGKLDNNPAVTARVVQITERLIPPAIAYRPETKDWAWSVKVIDDPKVVNAWCMAGGKMAIYTGLINQLQATDDEIAQVMGHEIAHALAKHQTEQMSRAVVTQLGVNAVAIFTDARYAAMAQQAAAGAAKVAIQLPNSREAESEADRIGIELAAKAGYNPKAAVTLWQKMAKVSGSEGKSDFLSTHPAPEKRMEALGELVPQMMPFYQDKAERPVFKLKASAPAAQSTARAAPSRPDPAPI
ncbi:MAG: M48 family metallopeptidase [Burkholderiales bacterium]|nr:M48 family metallopeptidase [Burkholderiales bacterium]